MSGNKTAKFDWSLYRMISNAKLLQKIANHLDADMELLPDSSLFDGKFIAALILMVLATEIALKALKCQKQKEPPKRTHDLLKLFEDLSEDTQTRLEEGLPSRLDPVFLRGGVQDLCPVGVGMRKVLEYHRRSFERWRYLHEVENANYYLPALDEALTVIIETYNQIQTESD